MNKSMQTIFLTNEEYRQILWNPKGIMLYRPAGNLRVIGKSGIIGSHRNNDSLPDDKKCPYGNGGDEVCLMHEDNPRKRMTGILTYIMAIEVPPYLRKVKKTYWEWQIRLDLKNYKPVTLGIRRKSSYVAPAKMFWCQAYGKVNYVPCTCCGSHITYVKGK